jgi:hypothetical protein
MSAFQEAISPRRVITLGGRNYEIAKVGPGVFSDFEAEVRAQRIRELRGLGLSALELGECVAAIQRGAGRGMEETKAALSSPGGVFVLLWVVLRRTNAALTLAETKVLLDENPAMVEEIMEAMGVERDSSSQDGGLGDNDPKNSTAAQA